MFYKSDYCGNSLVDCYRDMLRHIPIITEEDKIIGPLLEIGKLDVKQIGLVWDLLPDIPDYEVTVEFNDCDMFFNNYNIFLDCEYYDIIQVFIEDYLSIESMFLNPNFNCPRIDINFSSSINEEENNKPSDSNLFLPGIQKEVLSQKLLISLYEIMKKNYETEAIKNLAHALVYKSSIESNEAEFSFHVRGRNEIIGENLDCSIDLNNNNISQLLDLFFEIIQKLNSFKLCRAKLHGDKQRVNQLLTQIPDAVKYISLNSGAFSGTEMAIDALRGSLKKEYMEPAKSLLKNTAIQDDKIEQLLEKIDAIKCEYFAVKWDTLGQWKAFSEMNLKKPVRELLDESCIRLIKTGDGLRFSIDFGDLNYPISKKRIIDDISVKIGMKFKPEYF